MKKILLFIVVLFSLFVVSSCEVVTSKEGKSAYQIALDNGFKGTEAEWLESLKGEAGKSLDIRDIYEEYLKEGRDVSFEDFLKEVFPNTTYIKGESAYDLAKQNGFTGTEEEWLESLKGERGYSGADGKPGSEIDLYSVYQKLVELNLYTGTYLEFANEYVSSVNVDNNKVTSEALLCSVKVISTNVDIDQLDLDNEDDISKISGRTGAGVIFKLNQEIGEAFFITNYHVIYDEDTKTESEFVYAFLYGNERLDGRIKAEFVGGTAQYDLAVYHITNSEIIKNSPVKVAVFADSDNLNVGTPCYAVGNPNGDGISITKGIISVDSQEIGLSAIKSGVTTESDGLVYQRVIRTDTPVNHGNSGGGLFDQYGKLIGIVNAKSTETDVDDMGYAIPANVVNSIIINIFNNCLGKENKQVLRCLIGITVTIAESHAEYDESTGNVKIVNKVTVHEVSPSGIAGDKLQVGDQIVEATLNGVTKQITRMHSIVDFCLQASVGDTITLKILRDGVEHSVELTFVNNVPQA